MAAEDAVQISVDRITPKTRRLYALASAIAVFGNLLLLVGKGAAAWASKSSAIYADAANSAGDVGYGLLMSFGLWLSLRPPDRTHPHGHRRVEPLVSLLIGGMMVLVGYEALRIGYTSWRGGPEPILSVWAYVAPVGVVLAKAGMFLGVRRIGRAAHSSAIEATAQDNLTDAISSAVALVGVVASRYLAAWADPLAAVVVALWIFRSAFGVLRTGMRQLVGGAASPQLRQAIGEAVRSVPGVLEIYQMIIDYVGPELRVDLHIAMDGALPLSVVHSTSHAVRRAVQALPEVGLVFVHVEPLAPRSLPPGQDDMPLS